jgi:hypothetical protein
VRSAWRTTCSCARSSPARRRNSDRRANPDVIYVGSGEGLQRPDLSTGDGIYKSTDGGRTWKHLGLREGQQIPQIAIDPKDPNRLFVAVLGHPYGPNSERGIFRSVDGGESFQRVLYKDPDTGASDVVIDPTDPASAKSLLEEGAQRSNCPPPQGAGSGIAPCWSASQPDISTLLETGHLYLGLTLPPLRPPDRCPEMP